MVILTVTFVGGWYVNQLAESKRNKRIVLAQRDIIASYSILKKDVEQALKALAGNQPAEGKVNEAKFLLDRINENLEKMNEYVIKWVKIINKYDINNILKK